MKLLGKKYIKRRSAKAIHKNLVLKNWFKNMLGDVNDRNLNFDMFLIYDWYKPSVLARLSNYMSFEKRKILPSI